MEPFNDEDIRMYFYENRLKTFEGWPFNEDCKCTPENMAKAGFIHTPSDNSPDIAMCFFCLKELEGWEPEDEPEKEHQSHSPSCYFIALKKKVEELSVEEFIKLQKERHKSIIFMDTSDSVGEDEQLTLKLINRPMLILRGSNGFICHHRNSNTLDASRSIYDIFTLEFGNGAYHIKGVDGRFWYVNNAGLVCSDGDVPEDFSLELLEHGRLAIHAKNGKYLRGDQGGTLKGDGLSLSSSVLWEY